MRVLVVEDDARLADVLFAGLVAEGFGVDVVHDGLEGYWQACEGAHDVIVLDIMLPSLNGYDVARRLRAEQVWTPVLMLTAKDGAHLPTQAPGRLSLLDQVRAVATTAQLDVTVRRSDRLPATDTRGTAVLAADDGLLSTLGGELAAGHWLNHGTNGYPTVVLGTTAARLQGVDLNRGEQVVWLGDQWFAVVGVLKAMPLAPELDNTAMIGDQIARQEFGYEGSPTTVYLRTDPRHVNSVYEVAAGTADPRSPEEVEVTRPSDALEARAAADTSFTALLLGLGGVALLVGGVGIGNVMVISVLERRGEIGVRRALGASRRHIRAQFLVEALAQAGAGGLVGVALGAAITVGYDISADWPVVLPAQGLAGGVLAALTVGGLAGLYPASRAARLQPAEAVRPV
ncbi:FtsX-like permease family protein [Streptomyces pseudovenezuelae]|uniref:ABC transport system permease protein n=1 Tax=Streptomyces pseudovenezuelae TaxID=67350 RepID=A0ABT6LNS3_9ACTN|nr:FtsX-like permease family protein [Streptomyces pseudovenezuelae]MDH6217966.1 putative ABC transport system permease protein [Streptomyces pseudovenezuelae]